MKPNKKGLWLYQDALRTGKKIYDFREQEEINVPMDLFTYSELKDFFDLRLDLEERLTLIYGFKITKFTRGCVPLYKYDLNEKKVIESED